MGFSKRTRIEELSTCLKRSHKRNRILVVNLTDYAVVLTISLICFVGSISREKVSREYMLLSIITGLVRLYSIVIFLNKRSYNNISAASSSRTYIYITEVTSGKSMFTKFINKAFFVENSRKIKLLNSIYLLRVPYEYKVINIKGSKITIVIIVSRYIFKVNNKVSNVSSNCLSYKSIISFSIVIIYTVFKVTKFGSRISWLS